MPLTFSPLPPHLSPPPSYLSPLPTHPTPPPTNLSPPPPPAYLSPFPTHLTPPLPYPPLPPCLSPLPPRLSPDSNPPPPLAPNYVVDDAPSLALTPPPFSRSRLGRNCHRHRTVVRHNGSVWCAHGALDGGNHWAYVCPCGAQIACDDCVSTFSRRSISPLPPYSLPLPHIPSVMSLLSIQHLQTLLNCVKLHALVSPPSNFRLTPPPPSEPQTDEEAGGLVRCDFRGRRGASRRYPQVRLGPPWSVKVLAFGRWLVRGLGLGLYPQM